MRVTSHIPIKQLGQRVDGSRGHDQPEAVRFFSGIDDADHVGGRQCAKHGRSAIGGQKPLSCAVSQHKVCGSEQSGRFHDKVISKSYD